MYAEVTEVSVEIWEVRKAYAQLTEASVEVAACAGTWEVRKAHAGATGRISHST